MGFLARSVHHYFCQTIRRPLSLHSRAFVPWTQNENYPNHRTSFVPLRMLSDVPTTNYTTMYRFTYIHQAKMFQRFKYYKTMATVVLVPPAVVLHLVDLVSATSLIVVSACSVITCASLHALGLLLHNLVGIMYLSEDKSTVKVAYLTYWGKRKDVVMPVSDVMPISESESDPYDVYLYFRRYSTKEKFRYTLRFGKILDYKAFSNTLGELH